MIVLYGRFLKWFWVFLLDLFGFLSRCLISLGSLGFFGGVAVHWVIFILLFGAVWLTGITTVLGEIDNFNFVGLWGFVLFWVLGNHWIWAKKGYLIWNCRFWLLIMIVRDMDSLFGKQLVCRSGSASFIVLQSSLELCIFLLKRDPFRQLSLKPFILFFEFKHFSIRFLEPTLQALECLESFQNDSGSNAFQHDEPDGNRYFSLYLTETLLLCLYAFLAKPAIVLVDLE